MVSCKICGLKDIESINAAVSNGADYIGFIFYPPSPRNIPPEDAAKLAARVEGEVSTVAVFVDPSDSDIDSVLKHFIPSYLQLHGSETPERVSEIKEKYNIPIIKALPIEFISDMAVSEEYKNLVEIFLFDAKNAGSGESFSWKILKNKIFSIPYMLAGGINSDNAKEAIEVAGAKIIDVSSGVESERGVKDPVKIKEFLKIVKKL